MGLPIALGMALANRGRRVHCVVSDGECAEGSIWEALAARARLGADNLHVVVNMNGFSAYDSIDLDVLEARLRAFDANIDLRRTRCELPFAKGYAAHYHILSEAEYRWLIEHDEVAE